MPCDSKYLEPTSRERTSLDLKTFLLEAGLPTGIYDRVYGDINSLDTDTRILCSWCKSHDVSKMSLEFQIWWRDHQKADRERELRADLAQQKNKAISSALAKLTPEERKLLGL